jgi:hypothetical protein
VRNDAVLAFAASVKRATRGELAVGIALPSLVVAPDRPSDRAGLLDPLIAAPDLDFYLFEADGVDDETLTGSLAVNSKPLFYRDSENHAATAIARSVGRGAGLILSASPDTLRSAAHLLERGHRLGTGKAHAPVQVAVIVDPLADAYLSEAGPVIEMLGRLRRAQLVEVGSLGTPYHLYTMADMFHPKFPDHRVYSFWDVYYLSEAERRRVDARVKRSEQFALFSWATGLLSESGGGAEMGQGVTGQKLRVETATTSLRIKIVESDDPTVWGYHVGATIGTDLAVAPTITVTDRTTRRLGANGANKTVLAVRSHGTWTSLVCGTLPVPCRLLRNAGRITNSHLYLVTGRDGDRVWSDGRLVAVHSRLGGTITLSLPAVVELTNLDSGVRHEAASDLTFDMAPGSIACFAMRAVRSTATSERSRT